MNDKDKVAHTERVVKIILDEDYYVDRSHCDDAFKQVFYEVACAERGLRKAIERLLSTSEDDIAYLRRQLSDAESEVEALRETVKHVTNELEDARVERDIATKSAKRLIALLTSVHHRLPGDVIQEMLRVDEVMKKVEKK
jgi:chromosome segregation ATPase